MGTVQYNIQYSTVQYSTVQYSTVHYSTVQYSTVQYSTVQPVTVQFNFGLYNYFSFGVLNLTDIPYPSGYGPALPYPRRARV